VETLYSLIYSSPIPYVEKKLLKQNSRFSEDFLLYKHDLRDTVTDPEGLYKATAILFRE